MKRNDKVIFIGGGYKGIITYLNDMIDDAITELGEDFMVVVKKSTGQRDMVALKNLKEYGEYMDRIDDPIRSVFISADKHNRMFPES